MMDWNMYEEIAMYIKHLALTNLNNPPTLKFVM